MSKVSDWLIEMEEDALSMSREEWTNKHGESVIEMYNKIHTEKEGNAGNVSKDSLPIT